MDTSAYYALTDRSENTHETAQAIQRRLTKERWRLFTTNFVLAETHALLLNRLGYAVALRVITEIDRSATSIIRVTAEDERRARALIVRYDDKAFSLTDALSFVVMDRLQITSAFTFDRNFLQYGVLFPWYVPSRWRSSSPKTMYSASPATAVAMTSLSGGSSRARWGTRAG
jgi:predicted nucleic acid-binding protein